MKTTPKDPLSKALEELDATSQDFNKKMQESKTKLQKRIKKLNEIPDDQLPYKQSIEEPSFKENATSQDFNINELINYLRCQGRKIGLDSWR